MNCPYCGKEMTKGVVQGSRGFYFTTQPQSVWFWPDKTRGDFFLSSHNWTVPSCVAYHCAACRKVLFDYAAETE